MRARILPLLLAGFIAACGGKQVDTSIPIDEARVLNSEISTTYVRTRTLLEETTERVRALDRMPEEIDPADIDTDLLRHVLEACFTETVSIARGVDQGETPMEATAELGPDHAPLTNRERVGRLDACTPPRMLALETYLDVIEAHEREFVLGAVLEADIVRANLKDVLVVQIDEIERMTGTATTELLRLRETAEERRALAQTADLTPEGQQQTEVDYETITQELDQVEDRLTQLAGEIGDWRRLRRQLVDEAAARISALGTP